MLNIARPVAASAFILAALSLAFATPAAYAQKTVNVTVGGTDSSTCGAPVTPCATIDRAVANAANGDTVQFGPGMFNITAATVFTKTLTYRGAQAGDPGANRNPTDAVVDDPETVLTRVGSPTSALSALLTVRAEGVVVDGFTFAANLGGGGLRTYNQASTGAPIGGYRIVNNVFTGNVWGVFSQTFGTASRIADNLFLNNKAGAPTAALRGDGFYTDRAQNLAISGNEFRENLTSGVVTTGPNANLTYTDNASFDDGQGVVFRGVNGLAVTDNLMQGGSSGAIALYGGGNDDVRVERNRIVDKGTVGIALQRIVPTDSENGDVTIRQNTITGTRGSADNANAGFGIRISANGARGDVTIERNRIVDSAKGGLRNQDVDAVVDARDNWWGCNDGPGSGGCDTVTAADGGSTPRVIPWLTLSLTPDPAEIDAGAGATLLARLSNLSNSADLADGPFFDTAQAAFGSDPAGSFSPPTASLSAAQLTGTSAFTAAARPTELSVTVDNETVTIDNLDPPAPDVIPDVRPTDPTLTPGQKIDLIVEVINRGNRTARRLTACLIVSRKLERTGERCRRIAALRPGQTLIYRVIVRAKLNACRGPLANRLRLQVAGQPVRVRRAVARLLAGRCGPTPPCPTVARAVAAAPPPRGLVRARAAC